jgi:MerR family redox-sensitive transcriptional activator SoxR
VKAVLDKIPKGKAVGRKDWEEASAVWRSEIDERIALLQRLRGQLDHCMGCGCLSLETCPLYNPDDAFGANGPGPRRWTGDAQERAEPPQN